MTSARQCRHCGEVTVSPCNGEQAVGCYATHSDERPGDYRAAIARLGFNQTTIAPLPGVTQRTSQRYAADGAPDTVARLLAYMERYGADLARSVTP